MAESRGNAKGRGDSACHQQQERDTCMGLPSIAKVASGCLKVARRGEEARALKGALLMQLVPADHCYCCCCCYCRPYRAPQIARQCWPTRKTMEGGN